jgi:hypothetical protein
MLHNFFLTTEPSVSILTLKILCGGFLGGGLSSVFPIFEPFDYSFNTFFQTQKPLKSIQHV